MLLLLLGNSHTGVGDHHIEILAVGIEVDPHPTVVNIILYRILYEIAERKLQLAGIDLGNDRNDLLECEANISFIRDWLQSLEYGFYDPCNIGLLNI